MKSRAQVQTKEPLVYLHWIKRSYGYCWIPSQKASSSFLSYPEITVFYIISLHRIVSTAVTTQRRWVWWLHHPATHTHQRENPPTGRQKWEWQERGAETGDAHLSSKDNGGAITQVRLDRWDRSTRPSLVSECLEPHHPHKVTAGWNQNKICQWRRCL